MVEEEVGPLDQLNKVGPLDQLDKVGPLDQLDKEPKSEVAEKPVTKKWVARPLTTVSNFLLDRVVETHACEMEVLYVGQICLNFIFLAGIGNKWG